MYLLFVSNSRDAIGRGLQVFNWDESLRLTVKTSEFVLESLLATFSPGNKHLQKSGPSF